MFTTTLTKICRLSRAPLNGPKSSHGPNLRSRGTSKRDAVVGCEENVIAAVSHLVNCQTVDERPDQLPDGRRPTDRRTTEVAMICRIEKKKLRQYPDLTMVKSGSTDSK